MSTPTKRKAQGGKKCPKVGAALSPQTIEYLRTWMMSPEHVEHPYPNEKEKAKIIEDTGITSKQLTCWFSNNRKRFWKPKMEEMGRHAVVEAAMGNTLSPHTIEYLKAWMMHPDHIQNPYPTEEEKVEIMAATGIEKKQLTCWFSNNRKRFWKPKMDKLRSQYGLSESDPLPAAVLANAAPPVPPPPPPPPPPSAADIHINDDNLFAADILAAAAAVAPVAPLQLDASFAPAPLHLETSFAPAPAFPLETSEAPVTSLPLETSFAPVPAFPLETTVAPVAALPLEAGDAPVAALPLENFSASFFDAAADEVKSEEPPDNKRQKVKMPLDDIVAV